MTELLEKIAGRQDWKAWCDGMAGRKNNYETYVLPYLPQIEEWSRTMTEAQIIEKLGIGKTAWYGYKKSHSELTERIKKGRQNLVIELRGALIRRGLGYKYKETKTVTEQVHWSEDEYFSLLDAGFTPEQIKKARLVRTEEATKEMPPDVAALNLLLKNYDKEDWANDPQALELKKQELKLREKQIENNAW